VHPNWSNQRPIEQESSEGADLLRAGFEPGTGNEALVSSAAKYFEALNKLAKE
jgi:hypothetical protein